MPRKKGTPKTGGRTYGTLNRATASIREAAQRHDADAIAALAEIANDRTAPHAARIAAANSLLDRGHGKPTERIEHEDTGFVPPELHVHFVKTDTAAEA